MHGWVALHSGSRGWGGGGAPPPADASASTHASEQAHHAVRAIARAGVALAWRLLCARVRVFVAAVCTAVLLASDERDSYLLELVRCCFQVAPPLDSNDRKISDLRRELTTAQSSFQRTHESTAVSSSTAVDELERANAALKESNVAAASREDTLREQLRSAQRKHDELERTNSTLKRARQRAAQRRLRGVGRLGAVRRQRGGRDTAQKLAAAKAQGADNTRTVNEKLEDEREIAKRQADDLRRQIQELQDRFLEAVPDSQAQVKALMQEAHAAKAGKLRAEEELLKVELRLEQKGEEQSEEIAKTKLRGQNLETAAERAGARARQDDPADDTRRSC